MLAWLTENAEALKLLATIVGGGWLLWQYVRNSRIAAAVKAADEMEALSADRAVGDMLRLFDYGYGQLGGADGQGALTITPKAFRGALMHHDRKLAAIMAGDYPKPPAIPGTEDWPLYDDAELMVRERLDHLLTRLERIEFLIKQGLITQEAFGDYFSYWLQLLAETPRPGDMIRSGDGRRKELWRFIRRYEYNGVVRLFGRFGRAAPVGTDSTTAFAPRPAPAASPDGLAAA